MRAIKSLWLMVAVSGLTVMMGARSFAGPLMPPFPSIWTPGQKVAGQSILNVSSGLGVPITVDWIVVFWGNVGPNGAPVWGYYYQLENPETQPSPSKTIAIFTIETPGPPFFDANFIANQSLDENFVDIGAVPGHNPDNYPNLGDNPPFPPPRETEPVPGNIQNPTAPPSLTSFDVTFYFGPPPTAEIAVGNQSTVLIGYAFAPPMYGTATAQNTNVQWSGLVPVPSPEPGIVILLAMGLVGIAAYRRRK